MQTDKECINKYLKGNIESFNVIYDRYRRQLYSFLNRLMPGQPHIVDDIYQQTWIKAIDNFKRYKDKGKFFSWLMKIAHNKFIDYCRENSKMETQKFNYKTVIKVINPHDQLRHDEFYNILNEQIALLPPEQREVFLLRQDDFSFKEIAEIQNSNLNTVIGRMRQAILKLRNSTLNCA